ncbi:MAG: S9 family peptidase [Chthonomonas sp.]|nr:S9 family peptidase [Chthonomonas sp.]
MPKRALLAEDLLDLVFVSDPQFHPQSHEVLFARKHIAKNKYVTQLYAVRQGEEARQLTSGDKSAGHGRWSPDGKHVAFLTDRGENGQIFLLPTSGGEARQLTHFPEGSVAEFKYSPDGSKFAVLFRESHPDRTKEAAKKRETDNLSTPPWVLTTPYYRLDGDGYFGEMRYGLYLVDAATGEHTKLYESGPYGFYSFDWMPDGKHLVVSHETGKNPAHKKEPSEIFFVDMKGKAKKLACGGAHKSNVSASPDGKWIAYIAQTQAESHWGAFNQRVWVVSVDGKDNRCLTEGDDICYEVATLSDTKEFAASGLLLWSKEGKSLYTNIGWHGQSHPARIDVAKGGSEALTSGRTWTSINAISADETLFAGVSGDTQTMNEVCIQPVSNPKDIKFLTSENKAWHEKIKLAPVTTEYLETPDGTKVQIWVLTPEGRKQRGPAVLQVHGGPHAQYGELFFHEMQLLAAQGYVVVMSNPRGSKGYGEEHCHAISGDWGNKDWVDIQTVLHWMQHQPTIHSGLIGIMGGSYGGYMTNWAIGHTTDFRAAITDRCVSNLLSMGGNSDFIDEKDGYFGPGNWYGPIGDLESRWRQSPIAYFDKAVTPTLVIHSEGDLRCNVEQGEQVFSALWQRGIETRFARYPSSTSHGLSRSGPPDLRLHRLGEILAWWKRHLQG